jgi:hypothetical protein
MSNVKFTKRELKEVQAFYLEEKTRLEAKLLHINSMLSKLGGEPEAANLSVDNPKPSKSSLTQKGEGPKKRGPKSIWGTFIIKRLRARNKPMSYTELIEDAMAIHKLPENRKSAAKASILNSSFRLRTVQGKIQTIGRPGRKEKLIVLTKWLQEDGLLFPEYAKSFKKMQGGKAEAVDMSTVHSIVYEADELA